MKIQYKQDFARCSGIDCSKAYDCDRNKAYTEAKDLNLAYGVYIDSIYCIEEDYTLFTTSEEEDDSK